MKTKILFFINGPKPSEKELIAKNNIPGAIFRNGNALHHDEKASLEECNGVAGPAVPEAYAKKFKVVDAAQRELPLTAESSATGSEKPPVSASTEKSTKK